MNSFQFNHSFLLFILFALVSYNSVADTTKTVDCKMEVVDATIGSCLYTPARIEVVERPCARPQSYYFMFFRDLDSASGKGFRDTIRTDFYFVSEAWPGMPFNEGGTEIYFIEITREGDTCICIDTGYYRDDRCIGIEELSFGNADIYPNPVEDNIHIQGTGWISSYEVFNLYGKIVAEGRSANPMNGIDVSFLPPGMYNVLIDDGSKKVGRFLKQ